MWINCLCGWRPATDHAHVDTTSRHRRPLNTPSSLGPVRRIVTGHDALNRAVIASDGVPPLAQTLPRNGPTIYEIWRTTESPARIGRAIVEPHEERLSLAPPVHGTRIRVLDVLPEGPDAQPMHRSESIDYGIVLQGEMTLILDEGETLVRAGDIVVQRGTNHAWANRSGRLCRIAFILIDAKFEDGLDSALA